jgi:hypothetical protein
MTRVHAKAHMNHHLDHHHDHLLDGRHGQHPRRPLMDPYGVTFVTLVRVHGMFVSLDIHDGAMMMMMIVMMIEMMIVMRRMEISTYVDVKSDT